MNQTEIIKSLIIYYYVGFALNITYCTMFKLKDQKYIKVKFKCQKGFEKEKWKKEKSKKAINRDIALLFG